MKYHKPYRLIRVIAAVAFFSAIILSFSPLSEWVAWVTHSQLGPAIVRLASSFAWSTVFVISAIAILTFVFGRFYCALFCPLGMVQNFLGMVVRRKNAVNCNWKYSRYTLTALTLFFLVGGSSIVFLFLDPFSLFGPMAARATEAAVSLYDPGGMRYLGSYGWSILGAFLPLAILSGLVAWNKRIFCTGICPVGTLLGLLSRLSMFALRLTEACAGCGMCVKVCPAGCIDAQNRTIDNERCLRCMNCLSICGKHGISFSRKTKRQAPPPSTVHDARRKFLAACLLAVPAMLYMPTRFSWLKPRAGESPDTADIPILPPGADSPQQFAKTCTGCQLCVANCPTKIIRPSKYRYGPVHIEMAIGDCQYTCNRCNQVCPTNALIPLSLEQKQQRRIALAQYNARHCYVLQKNEECGLCAEICPTGAIYMCEFSTGRRIPQMNSGQCIGCGACYNVCPGQPKALTMQGVQNQIIT